jgi:hypothetical protein
MKISTVAPKVRRRNLSSCNRLVYVAIPVLYMACDELNPVAFLLYSSKVDRAENSALGAENFKC